MKKMISMVLVCLMLAGLVACGGSDNGGSAANGFGAESATAVLETAWTNYPGEQFMAMGGDYDNLVDGAPGAFDYTNAEYLDSLLAVPADAAAMIDGAASLMHGMMANNFTVGAFHLANASDEEAFVDAMKVSLESRHWLCGQPEKFVIISDGAGYVVAMFGLGEVVDAFAGELVNMGGTILVDQGIA